MKEKKPTQLKIHSKEEIKKYLLFSRETIQLSKKYDGEIIPWAANLSKNATESLVCHLVKDGILIPQITPITSVERFDNADVMVNNYHKLEVKATTTGEGTVTTSESNFNAFAWVWIDMKNFIYNNNSIIPIHVISNPKTCITTQRYVETLKQTKVTINSVIDDAIKTNNYVYHNFNINTFVVLPNIAHTFMDC